MERLVLEARALGKEDVVAVCGKVGGYNQYWDAFGPLGGRLHAIVCGEGRAKERCTRFPVSGAWRSCAMRTRSISSCVSRRSSGNTFAIFVTARVVRHHKRTMPHLPMVSGYHDPVTNRFIADTDHVRRATLEMT